MPDRPLLRVREVEFFERHVPLRLPFRFGVATLTEAQQVFVRVRIVLTDGRRGKAGGGAARGKCSTRIRPQQRGEFDQLRTGLPSPDASIWRRRRRRPCSSCGAREGAIGRSAAGSRADRRSERRCSTARSSTRFAAFWHSGVRAGGEHLGIEPHGPDSRISAIASCQNSARRTDQIRHTVGLGTPSASGDRSGRPGRRTPAGKLGSRYRGLGHAFK